MDHVNDLQDIVELHSPLFSLVASWMEVFLVEWNRLQYIVWALMDRQMHQVSMACRDQSLFSHWNGKRNLGLLISSQFVSRHICQNFYSEGFWFIRFVRFDSRKLVGRWAKFWSNVYRSQTKNKNVRSIQWSRDLSC